MDHPADGTRSVVVNVKELSAKQLEEQIQEPVFQLWRTIMKGPRYQSRDFCYEKFVDPTATHLCVELVLDRHDRLQGAVICKFIPSTLCVRGKLVTFMEGTAGLRPHVRGGRYGSLFMLQQAADYRAEFADRQIVLLDIATTPISFQLMHSRTSVLYDVYPKPGSATPADVEHMVRIRTAQWGYFPEATAIQDPWVRQGAQPIETPAQLYARMTMGEFEDDYSKYYFQRTGGVLGHGLVLVVILRDEVLNVDPSGDSERSLAKNRTDQLKTATRAAFQSPVIPGYDFGALVELRQLPPTTLAQFTESGGFHLVDRVDDSISWRGRTLFPIPAGRLSDASLAMVERILLKDVLVEHRSMLVFGADAGCIGLSAMLMGAEPVHFVFPTSDTSAYEAMRQHRLVNPLIHTVQQGGLADVKVAQVNMVVADIGTACAAIWAATVQGVGRIISDNGEVVLTVRRRDWSVAAMRELLCPLCGVFDLAHVKCILEPESDGWRFILRMKSTSTAHIVAGFDERVNVLVKELASMLTWRKLAIGDPVLQLFVREAGTTASSSL